MRKLRFVGLVVVFVFTSYSQVFGQALLKEKANQQYQLKAYDLAIESYKSYLYDNPNDVLSIARLAESFENTNNLLEAARWYEKIVNSSNCSVDYNIRFGKLLMKLGLYDKAKKQFERIGTNNPTLASQYKKSCDFAKNMLALGDKFVVSQLKSSTENDEFGAEIIGNKIIYSSFVTDTKKNSTIQRPVSDVFVYNNVTGVSDDFGSDVTNYKGISSVRYSPSGKYVVYTRHNFLNGNRQIIGDEKDMSVYIAEVDKNGDFVNEKSLPFNGVDYSTAFACFGYNDNIIYFSSNEKNNNFDIYVSHKVGDSWSDGKSLGDLINTPGNEVTPHFVEETLYFSSDYHNGLGGYDVFKSTLYKGEYSYPVNLGKGVNSSADDLYFVKVRNLEKGYVTSNRLGSKGGYDIYATTPSRNIKDVDLAFDYIPDAVQLASIEDTKGQGITGRSVRSVSLGGDMSGALEFVSFEGAKLVAYDDVIISPTNVYFIQLASLSTSNVNSAKFQKLTKYGNVYKVRKGALTKIRLGYFVSVDEAKSVLSSVKRQGFRDAFMVEDLLNLRELELLVSNYTFNENNKYKKPAEVGNYKIKLAAYTNPLYFDVNKVKDLGVIEQWSKGKWTIFVLSGYTNYDKAEAAMRKAVNRGFSSAQMVVDNNGVLSTVNSK